MIILVEKCGRFPDTAAYREEIMAKKNNRGQETLMDLLIGELVNAGDESSMIEICLSGNVKAISSIPLRYRLITLGLCKGFSVDELNQKLTENGCPTSMPEICVRRS